MAGTLGSLVLKLSADVATITGDLGKVANSSQKYAETVSKQWQEAGNQIKESFKGLAEFAGLAISADAIKDVVKGAIEAAQTVDNLSKQLGVSTQAIQAYSFAAGISGKSLDDVSAANSRLLQSAEKAAAGSEQQAEAFRSIGISAQQLKVLLKDPEELFETFAEHISSFADGAGKTSVAIELLGRSGAGLIPYLDKLGASFDELKVQARDLGVVLSSENESKLLAAGENIDLLTQASKGLANQLTVSLSPAINAVTESLVGIASSEGTHSFFASLGQDIGESVVLLGQAKDAIGEWASAFGELLGFERNATGTMRGDLVGYIQDSLDEAAKLTNAFEHGWIDIKAGFLIMWDYVRNSFAEGVGELEHELGLLASAAAKISSATGNAGLGAQMDAYAASLESASKNVKTFSSGLDTLQKEGDAADAEMKIWIDSNAQWADGIRLTSSAFDIFSTGLDRFQKSLKAGDIAGNLDKLNSAEQNIYDTAKELITQGGDETKINADRDTLIKQLTHSVENADKAQINYNASVGLGANAAQKLADMFAKDAQAIADAGAKLNPVQKIYQDYVKSIEQAVKAYEDEIDHIEKNKLGTAAAAQALQNFTEKRNADLAAMQAQTAEQIKQNDVVGKLFEKISNDQSLIGLTDREKAQQQAVNQAVDAWTKLNPAIQAAEVAAGKIDPTTAAGTAAIKSQTAALYDQQKAFQLQEETAKQWQSIWATAGNGIADTFSKILVEGGSLMKGLKDIAKQTVEAIISYFTKLAVINPILNSIFGGGVGGGAGFSVLPTLASAGGIFGGGGASAEGQGGGIFSASSWAGAGQNLFGGFSNAFNNFSGSVNGFGSSLFGFGANEGLLSSGYGAIGGADSLGLVPDYANLGGEFGDAAGASVSTYGGELGTTAGSSFLSTVGPILGAAALGYQVGGVAGAVGLAAAAYFIPVVGWIAGGLALVNTLTGGGLLGTSYKPTGNTGLNISTSASGIDVGATAEEKRKKALFQGSQTRTIDISVPEDVQNGLNQFFDQLNSGLQDFAKQFGTTTASVVDSTFKQTFDKSGKVTSTTESVGGVTYNDTTPQQYEERLQAESFLSVLDKMGLGASAFVAGVQGDADALSKAVEAFAAATQEANTNLGNGFKFMALSSDQTLKDVITFVEGLAQSGETLQQAYERLAAAQQQYDQFVGQFKPATVYVDDFEGSMSGLYKQLLAAQAQANALAKAAGASSANVQDLTNITNSYAQQMAALTVQLEGAAQSLAFSLGITTKGTLDQVNQEISDLESKAGTGSSAISGFGSAIHDASQKANDAINLLLGNLSPLNDQQKLQTALNGLRSGTVTADQVLEIGRRLYASSEAYTTLFNTVQGYAGKGGGGGTSVYARGGGSSSSGLTSEEQTRLQQLLAEQQTLQAAQTLGQYQTLAQQIAEIASAKQESWQDVLKEMDVRSSDLEKGLGLANDDALNSYIQNIQKQTDSASDNTQSIVDAILALPGQIAAALSGTLPAGGSTGPNHVTFPVIGGTSPSTPPGTGNNGTGTPGTGDNPGSGGSTGPVNLSNQTVQQLGSTIASAVVSGMQPTVNGIVNLPSRNLRGLASVR